MAERVTGIFATRAEAEAAAERARDAGFSGARLRTPADAHRGPGAKQLATAVAGGTALGAVVGAILGYLASLHFSDVNGTAPGSPTLRILPIVITVLLIAALGGLVASWIFSAFFATEDVFEAQELESGRYEVVVPAAGRIADAALLLSQAGALDVVTAAPLIAGG